MRPIKRFLLKNGITVLLDKRPGETVAISLSVRVGSNDEPSSLMGISHLIEHLTFDATEKYSTNFHLSNQIERLGGELNAFTGNERTCYYSVVPTKHCSKAIEVLYQLVACPLFKERDLSTEKKVVLEEVKMTIDDVRYYQWTLFLKTLYKSHPARNPIYGTVPTIRSIRRIDLLSFHKTHYVPTNLVIAVVGDFPSNIESLLASYFGSIKGSSVNHLDFLETPLKKRVSVIEKRPSLHQCYVVLGYQTISRSHRDSYILDVIRAVLGRGQSGKLFTEIRSKHALVYSIGVEHDPSAHYGFFAVYFNANKSNVGKAISLVKKEFIKLLKLTPAELVEAKTFLEGDFLLHSENKQKWADLISFWELAGNVDGARDYIKKVNSVSLIDVKRVVKNYLTDFYTLTIVEGEKNL